jgi:hypothetical protein
VGLVVFAAVAGAEETDPKEKAFRMSDNVKGMMKKWIEVAAPSEAHEYLQRFVGEWDVTIRMSMAGPTGQPLETKAVSRVHSILGGRFIVEELEGELMQPDLESGMKTKPFSAFAMTGYENYKKIYVGSWADSINTHLIQLKGTRTPSGGKLTMYGEMDEPTMGVSDRLIKIMTTIQGDDQHRVEVFDLHVSDDYKVLEYEYNRR